MAIPTLMLSPNLSRDANGPISPSISGAVRTVPFDGSTAWFVEEATTNLVKNPLAYGVSTTSSWSQVNGVLSIDTDGTNFLKVARSGTSAFRAHIAATTTDMIPVTVGTTYTFSVDVKNPLGLSPTNGIIRFDWRDASNVTLSQPQQTIGSFASTWTRYTISMTAPASAAYLSVQVVMGNNGTDGDWFGIRQAQVEAKTYATTFCPQYSEGGSLLSGYAWSGVAHLSQSVRTEGRVYMNIPSYIDPAIGSMYARTYAPPIYNSGAPSYIVGVGTGGVAKERFVIRMNGLQTVSYISVSNQITTASVASSPAWPLQSTWNTYLEWNGNDMKGKGADGSLASFSRPFSPPSGFNGPLSFGSYGSVNQWNERVHTLLVFPRPLSASEIAKLDATPTTQLGWNSALPSIGYAIRTGFNEPLGIIKTGGTL